METNQSFFELVLGLQQSAWMLMGKIANPMTGKTDKNLEAAKATIDTLSMLKEKTKGNLSKEEDELLSGALQQLQINFVSENSKKGDPKEETKKESINTKDNQEQEKKEETSKEGPKDSDKK